MLSYNSLGRRCDQSTPARVQLRGVCRVPRPLLCHRIDGRETETRATIAPTVLKEPRNILNEGEGQPASADYMREINDRDPSRAAQRDLTVVEFYDQTYLPFVTENLKPSSWYACKQIWNQHPTPDALTLKEYRTHMGSQFLTVLAKKLGRNTLQHIRSAAIGIFTHALNVGLIESNPWHDVKVRKDTRGESDSELHDRRTGECLVGARGQRRLPVGRDAGRVSRVAARRDRCAAKGILRLGVGTHSSGRWAWRRRDTEDVVVDRVAAVDRTRARAVGTLAREMREPG
jgi:hypothetical protein